EPAEQALVMADLMKAAEAVQAAYEPFKLNYACFGNQVPHVHWHIFPRFAGEHNLCDQPFSASSHFSEFRTTPQQAAEVAKKLRRAL
ncbi:MAG: HIT domain-containing protein, partial [Armatimonadetes bacterium]|nr:HIT domain-containing protein [Armatimonadota bacterium]